MLIAHPSYSARAMILQNDHIIMYFINVYTWFETVNLFLFQQENSSKQLKLAGKIEKFIKKEQID